MATNSANVKSDSTSVTPEAAINTETAPSTGKVPDAGPAANDENYAQPQAANDEVYKQSANSKDDVCFVSNAGPDSLTTTVIIKPDAGEALSVQMAQGQKYFLDMYEKDVVSFDQQGENLKLVFADGSSILLVGYFTATSGDLASTMAFRDDFALEQAQAAEALPEQLVPDQAKADEKAEDVAKVEPAAGDAESVAQQVAAIEPVAGEKAGQDVQNTGFTFRDPETTPVEALPAIGPIDPTALTYGINFQSTPVRPLPQAAAPIAPDSSPELAPARAAVDETNLSDNSPLGARGTVIFDFGTDGPGILAPNGAFSVNGSALNGQLTSCGEPVNVTATANGYVGTVTVNGITTQIFTLTINPNTGDFTFQQFGALDHNDPNNPDDALNLVFGVRATDGDGDGANTTITIRVNDDGPSAGAGDVRTIDESGLDGGNVRTLSGDLDFDFGADGPESIETVFDFTGVEALTSGGQRIEVTETENGFIGQVPGSRVVAFEITINDDGTYQFIQRAPLDHAPNSDTLALRFTFTITDCDGDRATTQLVINVTDSGPEIVGNGNPTLGVDLVQVDETNLPGGSTASGQLNIDYGVDGPGSLTSNGTFSSSSPLTSGGNLITVTATANGYVGTITVNGVSTTVFTLTVNNSGSYTFVQREQIDHPNPNNPNDPIRLNFGVTARDGDGDPANGTIRVDVLDDGPVAVDDGNTVLENTLSIDGNVLNNDDVGEDTTGQGGNGEVVSVTFNGQTFVVVSGADDTVITGQYGTLTINSTGQYTYTSFGTNASEVQDRFTYTIRDFDGDTDTAVLTITVQQGDDSPEITPAISRVDETDLSGNSPIGTMGTVNVDFGNDGPGTLAPSGTFSVSGSALGGQLTSNGIPVTVTATANGYVGSYTINGVTVTAFTLEINPVHGNYVFQQFRPLDHNDPNNPDDNLNLVFGVRATDADGDSATTTITIRVFDDGPKAVDDGTTVLDNTNVVSGNVLTNDDVGADGGLVESVTFNNFIYPVIQGTPTTIVGQYGTLVINANGSYTYTSFGTNISEVRDQFNYTIRDFDGDTDTAVLTIIVQDQDSTPIVATPRPLVVDETDLSPTDSDGSVITVDFGGDGPGTFSATGTNTFSFSGQEGQALTSNGVPVIVTLVGNDYVGTANGVEVFKLTLNPTTGAYNFTLSGTLDHGNPNDPDDAITLNFGVTVRDADGDTANTSVRVIVRDDGPSVGNDVNNFSAQAQGQDFNVVMMLDVSGSMAGDKIRLLKAAVANLFADLNDYTGGQVMVHLVPFSTDTFASGTFDISTPEGYAAALAYLNALETEGGLTNYEAPLQDAISWLQSGNAIPGAQTYTYFVSDGQPNVYMDNNGNWVFVGSSGLPTIIGEITGSDGTNEVALLRSLSTEVISVGIGVNAATLNVLDLIDSNGDALDVQDPNDLNAAFQGTIPLSGSTSGNVITGQNGGPGAGDDVGADGAVVTSVTFNGIVYAVHPLNGVTIQGVNGVLVMRADGSYTYVLDRDATPVNGVLQEQFSYTLRDGDGDTSTATLTLRATVNPPPAPDIVDIETILPVETHSILVAHGVDPVHGEHDGEVIYGLPYQTQPVVKPSAEYTTKPPIYIKPVDGIKDDVVTRPPVIEKPVDSSKPAIKPAIKPVDVIKDDPVEHGLPVDGVKDDNHHYMDDGNIIYGLPYQQPVIKPVDVSVSDDVVYTRPPIFEKPVDGVKDDNHHYMDDGTVIYGLPYQQPVIKPVDVSVSDDVVYTRPPIFEKPATGGDDIFFGPPVEAKPLDSYAGKLKIGTIKDIADDQHDEVVLFGYDIISAEDHEFIIQPIDMLYDLPADIMNIDSVLHGVDALQESINDFVVSTSANDNHIANVDSVSTGHNVTLFASAFSGVSGVDLNDTSEQVANVQSRV